MPNNKIYDQRIGICFTHKNTQMHKFKFCIFYKDKRSGRKTSPLLIKHLFPCTS